MEATAKDNARKALAALLLAAKTVQEAVAASGPMGIPEGHVYAALSAHGMTLPVFEQIIAALVGAGKIRKDGHLLRPA